MKEQNLWLKTQLERFLGYGYRFCYGYHVTSTLSGALTFKMLATSREQARELANKVLTKKEKRVRVWDMREELNKLT